MPHHGLGFEYPLSDSEITTPMEDNDNMTIEGASADKKEGNETPKEPMSGRKRSLLCESSGFEGRRPSHYLRRHYASGGQGNDDLLRRCVSNHRRNG